MTIKKKATKSPAYIQSDIQDVIDQVIGRGGKTSGDENLSKPKKIDEVRFTLRLSKNLVQKIDESRKRRAGIISRNQWILETLSNSVELIEN